MNTTTTIPTTVSDPVNEQILEVSEDCVAGFHEDPIGEIARLCGVDAGTVSERLQAVTVADVMDPDPFTLDGDTTLLDARERIFDAHQWPFVPVVDRDNRFLGVLRREAVEAEIEAGRPALTAREAVGGDRADWLIRTDQQLEDLLGQPALRGPGAVFAVDREDFLRGVVTIEQVRRAVTPAPGR